VSVNSGHRPLGLNEIGVLKTSALLEGEFLPDQNKTVIPKEVRRVRESVMRDSILVSRTNTVAGSMIVAPVETRETWRVGDLCFALKRSPRRKTMQITVDRNG
jgi:hypothetical protein